MPSICAGSWYSWSETVSALLWSYLPLLTSGRSVTLSCVTRGRKTNNRTDFLEPHLLEPHHPNLRRRPLDRINQTMSHHRQIEVGIEVAGITHRIDEALVNLCDIDQ